MRDMETIHEELRKKVVYCSIVTCGGFVLSQDEQYVANQISSLEKVVVRGGDKTRKLEYVSFKILCSVLSVL